MKAVFVELPAFTRHRSDYLDDRIFRAFQQELLQYPEEQFWLFTVYDKDERNDLSYDQRKLLKQLLEREVRARELT